MAEVKGELRVRGKSLQAEIWVDGKRRRLSTGFFVGDEAEAQIVLEETMRILRVEAPQPALSGASTVRELARAWVDNRRSRGKKDWANREGQFRMYLLPTLGDLAVTAVTQQMMMKWAEGLEQTKGQEKERLNPRYIGKIARGVRVLFKDAVKRGLIKQSPCTWEGSDLPEPNTSPRDVGEGFDAEAVERLIYDERIPADRRVLYALEFLTGMRTGEAAARCWKDWDRTFLGDLGRLVVACSWDSKSRTMNESTKTGEVKWIPVHPALESILTAWHEDGFRELFGRDPRPEDPIVPARWAFRPARPGRDPYPVFRHHSASWRSFGEDLQLLGIPHQRHYESRSSFVSLAEAGGATSDDTSALSHAGKKRSYDLYRRPKLIWPKVCRAVRFIQVRTPAEMARGDESGDTTTVRTSGNPPQGGASSYALDAPVGRQQLDSSVLDIPAAQQGVAPPSTITRLADTPADRVSGGGSLGDFLVLAGQLASAAAARGDLAAARALLDSAQAALALQGGVAPPVGKKSGSRGS